MKQIALIVVVFLVACATPKSETPPPSPEVAATEAEDAPPCDPDKVADCVETFQELAGQPDAEDPERVLRYGCDEGDLDSCFFLSQQLMGGDTEAGLQMMKDTCDAGYRFACVQYGSLFLFDGPAGEQDYSKSREYFEMACAEMADVEEPPRMIPNGQAYGCTNLGALYENAQGVEKDYDRAYELSKFACEQDYGNGCNQVGVFIKRGWVEEPDKPQLDYFLAACEFRDGPGCCNVASTLRDEARALDDGRDADYFVGKASEVWFDCEKWRSVPPSE